MNDSNLPSLSTRVVGRRETIDHIRRDVIDTRLVSIVGSGGIGKTTVALAVAELAIDSFTDGVWMVDFAPLGEESLVPNAIAAATGLVVHSANTMSALCRYLRDRRTLLVLDNCEHMADAVASCVTTILAEAPAVHVLTTSRAPLRARGEQVHRLLGLTVPTVSSELTAAEALTFPAVELFVERAADRLERFTLSDADAPAVADICKNLDGIALAIELAAMRVDVFGVRGLQKQLGGLFRLLGERRAGLERHRTLAATLDWSYGLLPSHEATLLRAVSVFPGAFRVHDASAVAELPAGHAATLLNELAAQSLLSADGDERDVIYRPLETTRAYCLAKLIASGADLTVRLRHAEYVCEVLERATHELAVQPAREWGVTYGRYLDDLRAALAWAAADPTHKSLLIRLATAGTVLWNHFSLADETRTHVMRAIVNLREVGSAGTEVEMNLQLALAGAILFTRGLVPEAREAMARALEIAVQRGDAEYHLRCLRMIATYELFNGDNNAAIQTLETFVSLAVAADPSAIADGETHLACSDLFVGRFESARQRIERLYAQVPLDLNDSLRFLYNNRINIMIVDLHVQWLMGAPDAAEQTAATVMEYSLEANHEVSLSNALAWVCLVYFWTGRDEECSRHSTMMDDLVERHGIVLWRPVATFCRGALACQREETLAEGVKDLELAVAECHARGHLARLPYYTAVLAEGLARGGRLQEADATIRSALDMARTHNDNWSSPELLRIQAYILGAQGRGTEQEATLTESLALAEKLGGKSWQLRAAIDLARLWQARGRSGEAKRMLTAIYRSFSEGFETRDLVTAARLLDELAV